MTARRANVNNLPPWLDQKKREVVAIFSTIPSQFRPIVLSDLTLLSGVTSVSSMSEMASPEPRISPIPRRRVKTSPWDEMEFKDTAFADWLKSHKSTDPGFVERTAFLNASIAALKRADTYKVMKSKSIPWLRMFLDRDTFEPFSDIEKIKRSYKDTSDLAHRKANGELHNCSPDNFNNGFHEAVVDLGWFESSAFDPSLTRKWRGVLGIEDEVVNSSSSQLPGLSSSADSGSSQTQNPPVQTLSEENLRGSNPLGKRAKPDNTPNK